MSFAIRAFVGPNGGGKTLAAVEQVVMPSWAKGRPVVSNLKLDPAAVGYAPELYVPLTSWRQIVDLRGCALVLDEISSVLPSRQAMSVPPQLVRVLNQLRKIDVAPVAWTAPNWARADVLLREVTQAVTVCRGFLPDRYSRTPDRAYRFPRTGPKGERLHAEDGWGPNRMFRWLTYDAVEFDEFTYALVADVKPMSVRWYWRAAHHAHRAYDTRENVDLLDHLDDIGVCVGCGGNRTRHSCSCSDYVARKRGETPKVEGDPAHSEAGRGEPPKVVHEPRPAHSPINGRKASVTRLSSR